MAKGKVRERDVAEQYALGSAGGWNSGGGRPASALTDLRPGGAAVFADAVR